MDVLSANITGQNNKTMKKEEAIKRHKELHACLDQLVACYIMSQGLKGKGLIDTNVMEFIKWSHEQTINPSCHNEQSQQS